MDKQYPISLNYCTRYYCATRRIGGNNLIEKAIEFLTRSKLRKEVKDRNGDLERDMRVLDELARIVHCDKQNRQEGK